MSINNGHGRPVRPSSGSWGLVGMLSCCERRHWPLTGTGPDLQILRPLREDWGVEIPSVYSLRALILHMVHFYSCFHWCLKTLPPGEPFSDDYASLMIIESISSPSAIPLHRSAAAATTRRRRGGDPVIDLLVVSKIKTAGVVLLLL